MAVPLNQPENLLAISHISIISNPTLRLEMEAIDSDSDMYVYIYIYSLPSFLLFFPNSDSLVVNSKGVRAPGSAWGTQSPVSWSRWCDMVMWEDGDRKTWLWQNMLAATFWETPCGGPFGNWWCLSCWCLGGLSIVFRLVSWWHFGGVFVVSWRCSVMFLVFCSCFGGASVVSCQCSGGVLVLKEWYFLD